MPFLARSMRQCLLALALLVHSVAALPVAVSTHRDAVAAKPSYEDAVAAELAAVMERARPRLGNGPGVLGSPLLAQAAVEEPVAAAAAAVEPEASTEVAEPKEATATASMVEEVAVGAPDTPPTEGDVAAAGSLLECCDKLDSILSDSEDEDLPGLVTADDVSMTLDMLNVPMDAAMEGLVKRHTTSVDGDDESYVAYKALLSEVKAASGK